MMISAENSIAVSRLPLACRMTYPRPSLAPTNSPTTAPVTARVAATFSPDISWGSEAGKRIFMNVLNLLAPIVEVSSRISGSTERSPASPEMTIGKNAIRTATRIFGDGPNPSHTTNSGAMAIFGITWANRISG